MKYAPPSNTRRTSSRWKLDPVSLKRWRRFRNHRRGFWSLVILLGLYVVSLCSELICNDRPLYVRYEGQSYFPVFKFYPEDVFKGNGIQTRPDYKKLNRSDRFTKNPDHWMVFPPIPNGPNEIINPEALRGDEQVVVNLRPVPRMGTVNIDADLLITRFQSADVFLEELSTGDAITNGWILPDAFINDVATRIKNLRADATRMVVTNVKNRNFVVEIGMSTYSVRSQPPRDVRLTFTEMFHSDAMNHSITFNRLLEPIRKNNAWWNRLASEDREKITAIAQRAFDGIMTVPRFTLEGSEVAVTVNRNDVQWPFHPVASHWLGIDSAGRDVLARILYGLRISMTFGLLLVLFSMGFGTIMGAIQGYYGGRIDLIWQRIIEIWSTLPFLYIMIWLGSLYGRSFGLLLLCYGIFNWIGISAYVRAEFLRLRRMPFVDAARCLGMSGSRIMFRHILPNALTPIITFFPFSLVGAIGSLAVLDYLGFGLPPPTPSWGELLHQAQSFRWAWWLILYPSLALFAVMLMGVFVGEGVRDAYDPKPVMRME